MEKGNLEPQLRNRRGQAVSFDRDRLARTLFAAAEAIERPDALLARELAESVGFFLAQETDVLPVSEFAEFVGKILRELGQVALARAYLDQRLPTLIKRPITDYPADVRSAAQAGLLTLEPWTAEPVLFARRINDVEQLRAWNHPPCRIEVPAADRLLTTATLAEAENLLWRLAWHMGGVPAEREIVLFVDAMDADEGMFADRAAVSPEVAVRLFRSLRMPFRLAVVSPFGGIVPHQPMTRPEAVCCRVKLHANRLAEQLGTASSERFTAKLRMLAGIARAAGFARYDFLRSANEPSLTAGFLLERATVEIVPDGFWEATAHIDPDADTDERATLAARWLSDIRASWNDHRSRPIEVRWAAPWFGPDVPDVSEAVLLPAQRLRYAAKLHAAAECGIVSGREPCEVSGIRFLRTANEKVGY